MTDTRFSAEIRDIRSAIKQAHSHLLSNRPFNVTPMRDMIDGLTQRMGAHAPTMDRELSDRLAGDLSTLVSELEALESLMKTRLSEGGG